MIPLFTIQVTFSEETIRYMFHNKLTVKKLLTKGKNFQRTPLKLTQVTFLRALA